MPHGVRLRAYTVVVKRQTTEEAQNTMAEETQETQAISIELPAHVWERVQLEIQWESDKELQQAAAAIVAALAAAEA